MGNLEEYLKVKTGQDLIDREVIPKTSSAHLALITKLRLEALRDHTLQGINEDVCGVWNPLFARKVNKQEITNPTEILRVAKDGMKVIGVGNFDGQEVEGIEGTIRKVSSGTLMVEWSQKLAKGHDLDKLCEYGFGYKVSPQNVKLLSAIETPEYTLAEGVVADKTLGHKIKLVREYNGSMQDPNEGSAIKVALPAGTTAQLIEYNPKKGYITIRAEQKIPGRGNRINFMLRVEDACDKLAVSSLGQTEPLDKEEEVRKIALRDFFPKTVLEEETTEKILIALLRGKDMIFYGPPGGGKSNVAKDICAIAQQQEVIFVVEGCQVQCNPFSLFDEDFSKEVHPCPECMIKHDQKFKETCRFTRPRAKDIKVVVAKYGEGKGIEFTEGTSALSRMHLAGFKIPRLDGTTTEGRENAYDPEGFQPGVLPRSNNGLLHMDEADKLRQQVYDDLLEALNSGRIKPDQLRFTYPAHSLIIGTANDATKFSSALIDRIAVIEVDYPQDPDVSYDITRRGYHGKEVETASVSVNDSHRKEWKRIRSIPMPTTVERAVDAFYIKFRQEYNGAGKTEISGSNRSKFDALDAARAKLLLNQIFYGSTPKIATEEYALYGILYALESRLQETNQAAVEKSMGEIKAWVEENFPKILKAEEDAWWCQAHKKIAEYKNQIPELAGFYAAEITSYQSDVRRAIPAFRKVKAAYENKEDRRAQLAKVEYPFMNYLFQEQPNLPRVSEGQLKEIMTCLLKSFETASCKIDMAVGEAANAADLNKYVGRV